MLKLALRFIAVIFLIIIIIMNDFPFYEKMKDNATQLFLAIMIVAFIFYDTTFGFIMGLVLLLIYYEIYKKIIMKHEIQVKENMEAKVNKPLQESSHLYTDASGSYIPDQLNYLSEEHLLAAQNNVFDIDNFKTEVRGIEHGFNNEKVYGAQGLNSEDVNFMGYNREEIYADFSQ